MADLLSRLRERSGVDFSPTARNIANLQTLVRDAADEIERLRGRTSEKVWTAALWAAAPEMLAALQECATYIISPLRMTGDTDEAARRAAIFERARAAIAKAEGAVLATSYRGGVPE